VAAEIASTGRRHVLIVDDNLFNDREKAADCFARSSHCEFDGAARSPSTWPATAALLDLMAERMHRRAGRLRVA
jgi:hypothetical protein